MQLTGIHHLTAITADAPRNLDFYTGVLGLRLVKKTVNQDDVSAYHLFYADGRGSPGTDITFFDWPLPPARRGTHSISSAAFRVAPDSVAWWHRRLTGAGISPRPIEEEDGRLRFAFDDPEGQCLSIGADDREGEVHPWDRSPVPPEHQLRGLGPVTLSVPELGPTHSVLTRIMEMEPVRDRPLGGKGDGHVHVYRMGAGGPAAELHVAVQPSLLPAEQGAGGVHHVAFRTPGEAEYDAWAERLRGTRIPFSGKVDRYYFKSLYFREPNGILFEIATDGPGFASDEPMESLGERLSLPPFLESRRAEIEAGLKPL